SWRRDPHFAEVSLDLAELRTEAAPIIGLASSGLAGTSLHCRIAPWGDILLVTLAVTNDAKPTEARSRAANEEAALCQFSLNVECEADCRFVPKPDRAGSGGDEDDARASALLYRDVQQFAVGHTCSAMWDEPVDGFVLRVRTSWF